MNTVKDFGDWSKIIFKSFREVTKESYNRLSWQDIRAIDNTIVTGSDYDSDSGELVLYVDKD